MLVLLAGVSLWIGCGDQITQITCVEGERKCVSGSVLQCTADGEFITFEMCSTECREGQCLPVICPAEETRCRGFVLETCSVDGAQWDVTRICAGGCETGACVEQICAPGSTRCEDDHEEECNAAGTAWVAGDNCTDGCGRTSCAICTQGERRCTGSSVEACTPNGEDWAFVQFCATGCTGGSCNPLVCAPLNRRCTGSVVEVCNPNGTAWQQTETCTDGCSNGLCSGGTGGACVPLATRCHAGNVEACDALGGGWFYVESCSDQCLLGGCVGTACLPFAVGAVPVIVRADGESSTLVSSELILDASGTPVPDGTMVVVETSGGVLLTPDVDPSTPEREVATFNGVADVSLSAPSVSGSATVVFTLRGAPSCTGSVSVSFDDVVQPSAALDFATTDLNDVTVSDTFWDLLLGRVTLPTTRYGFGEDGDLHVSGTFDLTTGVRPDRAWPDAVQFSVGTLGERSATIDDIASGIQPGDDVLLIGMQGTPDQAGSVGNYEILSVRGAEGLRVDFVSPVTKLYAPEGNHDLTNHKVVLQRIPRYRTVTVDGELTARAWDGAKGGIIAFKASSSVSVTPGAEISATAIGYRGALGGTQSGESYTGPSLTQPDANGGASGGAQSCSTREWWSAGASYGTVGTVLGTVEAGMEYGTPLLDQWFLGSGGGGRRRCNSNSGSTGGAGGGLVVIQSPFINVAGSISSDGRTRGSGGTVYLRGETITIGNGLVHAKGLPASASAIGGDGRIRIDAVSLTGTTEPAHVAGPAPSTTSAIAQTTAIDALDGDLATATLLRVVQDSPGTSRLRYFLSNDGGVNWVESQLGVATVFPAAGSDLRVRVHWENVGEAGPPSLAGLAVRYRMAAAIQ